MLFLILSNKVYIQSSLWQIELVTNLTPNKHMHAMHNQLDYLDDIDAKATHEY